MSHKQRPAYLRVLAMESADTKVAMIYPKPEKGCNCICARMSLLELEWRRDEAGQVQHESYCPQSY